MKLLASLLDRLRTWYTVRQFRRGIIHVRRIETEPRPLTVPAELGSLTFKPARCFYNLPPGADE
jgi:hypothetical protein